MSLFEVIRRFYYRFRYRHLTLVLCEDTPDELRPGCLYIQVDGGAPFASVLQCPCGCGQRVDLNHIGRSPIWRMSIDPSGRLSLHPSVWRRTGCRSHFWVRRNEIVWARTHILGVLRQWDCQPQ